MSDTTRDVGYVHVLTGPGGPCVTGCPHPDCAARGDGQ